MVVPSYLLTCPQVDVAAVPPSSFLPTCPQVDVATMPPTSFLPTCSQVDVAAMPPPHFPHLLTSGRAAMPPPSFPPTCSQVDVAAMPPLHFLPLAHKGRARCPPLRFPPLAHKWTWSQCHPLCLPAQLRQPRAMPSAPPALLTRHRPQAPATHLGLQAPSPRYHHA